MKMRRSSTQDGGKVVARRRPLSADTTSEEEEEEEEWGRRRGIIFLSDNGTGTADESPAVLLNLANPSAGSSYQKRPKYMEANVHVSACCSPSSHTRLDVTEQRGL